MKEEIKSIQKRYGSRAMMIAITAAVIFIAAGFTAIAKGLVLGTLFSVINFILMGRALPARLNKTKQGTYAVIIGGIWLRYLVLAVPLILSINMDQFNMAAVAVGLFMVQAAILWDKIVARMIRAIM